MQQRAEAQRAAAREVVGERLGEQRGHRPGVLLAEDRRGVALERDGRLEHLERVAVDVAVVVAVLLDPAQRRQLGQHDAVEAELVHAGESRCDGLVGGDDPLELGEDALRRDRPRARRRARGRVGGRGVDVEAELAGASRARRSARSGSSAKARAPTMRRRRAARSAAAAVRVDEVAAGSGSAIALTVRSRAREVGLERAAASGVRSTCQARRGPTTRQAPNASESSKAAPPVARARRRRGAARVAVDARSRSSGRRDAEQAVAHGAADEPRALVAERVAQRVASRRGLPVAVVVHAARAPRSRTSPRS